MQKRGQFFLMAAIIIIIIVFGFIAIRGYIKTEEKKTAVYDLEKEFGLESGKVVDYVIYSEEDFDTIMKNWTEIYIGGKKQNVDEFVVVYGDSSHQKMAELTLECPGEISISGWKKEVCEKKIKITNVELGQNFKVKVGGIDYEFNITEGKNFIFLIREAGYVAKYD